MELLDNEIKKRHVLKPTMVLALSKLFERAAYYGLRALIVLYLTSTVINLETTSALSLYGTFASGFFMATILGGIVGDLVLGNRRTLLLGGVLFMVGALIMCKPDLSAAYVGLGLIGLGAGLYGPNLLASYGKLYIEDSRSVDSAFLGLLFAINIGAFIGAIAIGYAGERISYPVGFATAGLLMLLSIALPFFFTKEITVNVKREQLSNKIYLSIALMLLLLIIYWALAEFSLGKLNLLSYSFAEESVWNLPQSIWQSVSAAFLIPVGLLTFMFWKSSHIKSFNKIIVGVVCVALASIIAWVMPLEANESLMPLLLVAFLLTSIAEVYVFPVIYSLVVQYANPKYLAISMVLSSVPARIGNYVAGILAALSM